LATSYGNGLHFDDQHARWAGAVLWPAPVRYEPALRQDLLVTFNAHRLHQAFDEAELHVDTDTLQALLADDFRSIGEQGYMLDKAQWIGKFAEFTYISLESSDVEVRSYEHAAIVRCVQRSRSIWRDQEMALTVRVSQTWVEQPEGWRLADIQFSWLGQV
jgi:hypothetical protein